MQAIAQGVQFRREKPMHTADDEAVLRMPLAEDGEGAQQAIQVLVRVEGGDRQKERLGAAAGGESKKMWIDADGTVRILAGGRRIPEAQVVRGGAGDGHDLA